MGGSKAKHEDEYDINIEKRKGKTHSKTDDDISSNKSIKPSSKECPTKLSKDKSDKKQKKNKKEKYENKKKKKKKRSRHKSSSSDESEAEDLELLRKLEDEKNKSKKELQEKKRLMKSLETPEEKRLRRLNKKEAKERKRKSKMGWDNEYLHLTNEDNPYGDSNLFETFCWKKKLEKEGLNYLPKEEIQQRTRSKMEENRLELEKVKKRRQEREREKLEREKLQELEMRQKEAAQFSHFSSQEDTFQLHQARMRSQIRIQDGRAKPIDLLAQYVNSEGDVNAVDMLEPYSHLRGLTLGDLEDLLEDINVYKKLEDKEENLTYWNDLIVIVEDELRRLRLRDPNTSEELNNRQGIHASITDDVSKVFINKSAKELGALQKNIEAKLAGPTSGLDVGYWESLLSQIKAHQARASLRERHRDNLKKKLQKLKEEQGVEEETQEDSELSSESQNEALPSVYSKDEDNESIEKVEENPENEAESLISSAVNSYENGRYSPVLLPYDNFDPSVDLVDPEEDNQRVLWSRGRVLGGDKQGTSMTQEEKLMRKEAQKDMTSDEVQYSVECNLDPKTYIWSDKYRPRKPRYFNRVHTGFEWNKYNQTHYDLDTPPPKIVQGYKFNIFYPDLIDKSKTPKFELVPCEDNKDFTLLKFTASPPYEDIAFKIVSREWEYSYKRGFRCQFHNNIFQLWFHFKRYRYRR